MPENLILLQSDFEFPLMTMAKVEERVLALTRGRRFKADITDVPTDELPARINNLRFKHFNQSQEDGAILDAVADCEGCGRYTFLVYDIREDVISESDIY